jgi:hypothetical protein
MRAGRDLELHPATSTPISTTTAHRRTDMLPARTPSYGWRRVRHGAAVVNGMKTNGARIASTYLRALGIAVMVLGLLAGVGYVAGRALEESTESKFARVGTEISGDPVAEASVTKRGVQAVDVVVGLTLVIGGVTYGCFLYAFGAVVALLIGIHFNTGLRPYERPGPTT